MSKNIGEAYYTAMGEKNIAGIKQYLHPDACLSSPVGTLSGKEAVLAGAEKFMALFTTIIIRTTFGSENQAMVVYDLVCPAPIGTIPVAALMTLREGLIAKIELFFDSQRMDQKKYEVYSR